MLDKDEADAVFALPQGGVSGVLKTQFGPAIVRVKSITPSTIKPYAEVADEVKRRSPPPAPATRSRPCTTRSRTRGCPAKPSSKPPRRWA